MITTASTRVTQTGDRLGTLAYMPPEQLKDAKSADFRSDVFSLGRMLYEMYTGDLVVGIQDTSTLPVGISLIVDRCTRTDPSKRFQRVSDLRQAFRSVAAASEVVADEARVRALIAESATRKDLTDAEAGELADLLAASRNDTDLLHDAFMAFPMEAIESLWAARPVVTAALLEVFLRGVESQGWGFNYTDKIGLACKRLHAAIPDPAIRGRIMCAVLELGLSHNRYFVIDLAIGLISQSIPLAADARATAHALGACRPNLRKVAERLQKADPEIRTLVAGRMEDDAS